jgi:hypothetical protein
MTKLERKEKIEKQLQNAYADIKDYRDIDCGVWSILQSIISCNKKVNKFNVYQELKPFSAMTSQLKRRMYTKVKAFLSDSGMLDYIKNYKYSE